MGQVFKGVGLNWTCASTGITQGLTGDFEMQDRSLSKKADKFEARGNNGDVIGLAFYNYNKAATFTFLPTSATKNGSATVNLPAVGDTFTLADATIADFVGTNWVCDSDIGLKNSNKDAALVTIPLVQYDGMPTP